MRSGGQMTKQNNSEIKASPVIVYYDGKCGLCSSEIAYYRRIAAKGKFVWLDIARDPAPLERLGITQMDALRRLHACDEDGSINIGVDAFILIWQQLPRWKLLAVIVNLPLCRQLAEQLYNRFADYRFARLPHCQVNVTAG